MLKTQLLPHQESGTRWMIKRETESNGGMLLDRPGMGKTLTVISLLVTSPKPKTLVVCPAGVLAVWATEFEKHSEGFRVVLLRGRKFFPPSDSYDVMLASYQSLLPSREKKEEDVVEEEEGSGMKEEDEIAEQDEVDEEEMVEASNLFDVKWDRVIFDESHYLKNVNGKTFKRALTLQSEKLWIVTATPVFNKLDELFAYVKLLGIQPYASATSSSWQEDIVKPIETSGAIGFAKLRELMDEISLRRPKEILNLPPKTEKEVKLELGTLERRFYAALFRYTKDRVESLIKRMEMMVTKKKKDTGYRDDRKAVIRGTVLRMILRLRYAATSPDLAMRSLHRLQQYGIMSLNNPHERIKVACSILEWISERDEADQKTLGSECLGCIDNDYCYSISGCGHRLCQRCVDKIEEKDEDPRCPYCYLPIPELITCAPKVEIPCVKIPEDQPSEFGYFLSTKIMHVLSKFTMNPVPENRYIIVSEWTSLLDIVETFLKDYKIDFLRIDGKVSLIERQRRIVEFQKCGTKVILVSLCAVAEGVTLTAANRVIFLEPFWNAGKEEQAMNRCHRIGQTKEVYVEKLHMMNTLETGLFEMKEKKAEISESVVGDKTFSHTKASWVNNIRLFMKDRKEKPKKRTAWNKFVKNRNQKRARYEAKPEYISERLI